jgi:hypothetical protein
VKTTAILIVWCPVPNGFVLMLLRAQNSVDIDEGNVPKHAAILETPIPGKDSEDYSGVIHIVNFIMTKA